jgi:quinol monooxygenase YgiN
MPQFVFYATFTFKFELVEAAEALMKEVTRGSIQEKGCEYHCGAFMAIYQRRI